MGMFEAVFSSLESITQCFKGMFKDFLYILASFIGFDQEENETEAYVAHIK